MCDLTSGSSDVPTFQLRQRRARKSAAKAADWGSPQSNSQNLPWCSAQLARATPGAFAIASSRPMRGSAADTAKAAAQHKPPPEVWLHTTSDGSARTCVWEATQKNTWQWNEHGKR